MNNRVKLTQKLIKNNTISWITQKLIENNTINHRTQKINRLTNLILQVQAFFVNSLSPIWYQLTNWKLSLTWHNALTYWYTILIWI